MVGCLYSGLCVVCSALSIFLTISAHLKMSEQLLVSRYLKGIYNRHLTLPKYVHIWGIWLFPRYYDHMDSNEPKPNTRLGLLIYHHYPENNKLCIVNCLKSYVGM